MAQPIKKNIRKKVVANKSKKKIAVSEIIKRNIKRSKQKHPEYGTSKLEDRFAKEFLDKLGIKYVTQYYAKEIKRYYDVFIPSHRILIEIDGDYW